MIDRQTNFLFAFVILMMFILGADDLDRVQIFRGILISAAVVGSVFMIGLLSLDALFAAYLVGVMAIGFGDISYVIVLGVFFISSSLLTLISHYTHPTLEAQEYKPARRSGKQVWSNAFFFALFVLLAFLFSSPAWSIAAICALATATADTWATEVGMMPKQHPTVSIANFKIVPQGTDGGISLFGTIAAFLGSSLIAATFMVFSYKDQLPIFMMISISGFVGSLVDSLLGATLQQKALQLTRTMLLFEDATFSNHKVNWISTGIGGILGYFGYILWL